MLHEGSLLPTDRTLARKALRVDVRGRREKGPAAVSRSVGMTARPRGRGTNRIKLRYTRRKCRMAAANGTHCRVSISRNLRNEETSQHGSAQFGENGPGARRDATAAR